MMRGRRGILNQGAGTMLLGPPWRPPLFDKAGITLVIMPCVCTSFTALIPQAPSDFHLCGNSL